jgi:enoyl-CoA hydratase/carnithine racemase
MNSGGKKKARAVEPVDVVGLSRACRKPIVTAVKGITYTLGIELAIAGDIVVAALATVDLLNLNLSAACTQRAVPPYAGLSDPDGVMRCTTY